MLRGEMGDPAGASLNDRWIPKEFIEFQGAMEFNEFLWNCFIIQRTPKSNEPLWKSLIIRGYRNIKEFLRNPLIFAHPKG